MKVCIKKSPLSIFVLLFCVLILPGGCSKKNKTAAPLVLIPGTISGNLFFKNYYSGGTASVPIEGISVFIGYDSVAGKDSSNHFYSVQTGPGGAFSFYVPDISVRYDIFTEFADTSSKSFSSYYNASLVTVLPFNADTLYKLTSIIDSTTRNGLNLFTEDINAGALPGVRVITYTSGVAAAADTSFSGTGSFASLTTDSLGRGFFSLLPADSIFINSVLSLGSKKLVSSDTVIMQSAGIITLQIHLK